MPKMHLFTRLTSRNACALYFVFFVVLASYEAYSHHLDQESMAIMRALDLPSSKEYLGKKGIDRWGRMVRRDTTQLCGNMYSNYDICINKVTLHTNCQPLCDSAFNSCPGCDVLAADHANQASIATAHCNTRRDKVCPLTVVGNGNPNYDYTALYTCCLDASPPGPANCECEVQQSAQPVCHACGQCTASTCGVLAPFNNGDYLGRKQCSGTYTLATPAEDTASCGPLQPLSGADGYTYVACYEDDIDNTHRLLQNQLSSVSSALSCLDQCKAAGYIFCGIEAGGQCFGSSSPGQEKVPSTQCTQPCSDNMDICGGSYAISFYQTAAAGTTCPTGVDSCLADGTALNCAFVGGVQYYMDSVSGTCVTAANCPSGVGTGGAGTYVNAACIIGSNNGYTAVGCYQDFVDNQTRLLTTQLSGVSSVPQCLSQCAARGFQHCGLEAGGQCFGSNVFNEAATPTNICTQSCSDGELCGGSYAIEVYSLSGALAPVGPCTAPATGQLDANGNFECVLPTTQSGDGYTLQNCYVDRNPRLIANQLGGTFNNALDCLAACQAQSYAFCGIEFTNQCFGDNILTGAQVVTTTCTMPCADGLTTCGGPGSISVYKSDSLSTTCPGTGVATCTTGGTPITCGMASGVEYYFDPSTTTCVIQSACPVTGTGSDSTGNFICNSPPAAGAGYTNHGCFVDSATRVLPNGLPDVTSSAACVQQCSDANYAYCGIEFGTQCFGGNTIGALTASTQCTMLCTDKSTTCGGPSAIEIFFQDV